MTPFLRFYFVIVALFCLFVFWASLLSHRTGWLQIWHPCCLAPWSAGNSFVQQLLPQKAFMGECWGQNPGPCMCQQCTQSTTLHPQPTGPSLLLSYFSTFLERRKAVSLQTMRSCVPVVIPENVILSACPLHDAAGWKLSRKNRELELWFKLTRCQCHALAACARSPWVSFSFISRHISNDLVYKWYPRSSF